MLPAVNSLADYSAASLLSASHTAELRNGVSSRRSNSLRHNKARSQEQKPGAPPSPMRKSLDVSPENTALTM